MIVALILALRAHCMVDEAEPVAVGTWYLQVAWMFMLSCAYFGFYSTALYGLDKQQGHGRKSK